MTACATGEKIADTNPYCNLILPIPDTDFRDFLDEVEQLAGFAPEIIEAIEKDLDVHAREKKKLRLEDRRFFEGRTAELPELDIEEEEDILATELKLAMGRLADAGLYGLRVLDDSWVSRVVDDETGTAVSARVDELVWISSEPGPEDAGGDNDSGECEPGQLCDPRVDIGPTDSLDPEGGVGRFRETDGGQHFGEGE